MKTKRLISLLLAAVFALSAAATPALAASAGSELPGLTTAGVDENNSVVSIRLTADGDLTYGSPFTLSVQTTPADTQYIGVVMGTSGEAQGYVTLILSGKIRTLLKMIPLPKKMSANPEQEEEFNIYAYIKQLIDGNDVSVLLRVADEVVSVMDVLKFYIPTLKDVSTGMKLALELIRKYLPEGVFSRIYLDGSRQLCGRCCGAGIRRCEHRRYGILPHQAQECGCACLLGTGAPRQYDCGRGPELQRHRSGRKRRPGGRGRQGDLHL